jgi:serine/threonine-protein phosphatase 2A catalytic subunit
MGLEKFVLNPDDVNDLNARELSDILSQIEYKLKALDEKALIELSGGGKVILVGDTHGDFKITKSVVKNFFLGHVKDTYLVFLGDYIDRTPKDELWGSINNMVYLLVLKMTYPDRVYLLKGNHETHDTIKFGSYEFEKVINRKYGSDCNLHEKFVAVFKHLPLMVITKNGIFAAHGGILKGAGLENLRELDKNSMDGINSIVWSDPVNHASYRGDVGDNFNQKELLEFLENIGANVFVRSHDYLSLGYAIYNKSCLTIFSSRHYQDRGNKGVLIAEVDLNQDINDVFDLKVKEFKENWVDYQICVL